MTPTVWLTYVHSVSPRLQLPFSSVPAQSVSPLMIDCCHCSHSNSISISTLSMWAVQKDPNQKWSQNDEKSGPQRWWWAVVWWADDVEASYRQHTHTHTNSKWETLHARTVIIVFVGRHFLILVSWIKWDKFNFNFKFFSFFFSVPFLNVLTLFFVTSNTVIHCTRHATLC